MKGTIIKGSALVLGLALSGSVFAAEGGNGSNYLWQAPEGKFEVTPALGIAKGTYSQRATTYNNEQSKMPITVSGEYGICPTMAAGLTLGTDSQKVHDTTPASVDTKQTGMLDPVLFFKGRYDLGAGWLRYGANLVLGFQKHVNKSNGDSNLASGGMTLTPWAGWEMAAGPGTFGARLMFDLYKGEASGSDESTTPATDYKTTGGGAFGLTAFYEMPMGMWDIGGALTYKSMATTKNKVAGVSTSSDDGATNIMLEVYAPVHVNDMITVLPTLHYTTVNFTSSSYGIKSGSEMGLDVGARFTF